MGSVGVRGDKRDERLDKSFGQFIQQKKKKRDAKVWR